MQYDAQRSAASGKGRADQGQGRADAKAQPAKKSGRKAAAKGQSPQLRDRLREVIERDRALHDSLPAPERTRPVDLDDNDDLHAPAKSGTHARLPDYTRHEFDSPYSEREDTQRVSLRSPVAPAPQPAEDDAASSVFAEWIEAELVELDESEEGPLLLADESDPSLSRVSTLPSSFLDEPDQELQPALEPAAASELVLDFESALLTEPADDEPAAADRSAPAPALHDEHTADEVSELLASTADDTIIGSLSMLEQEESALAAPGLPSEPVADIASEPIRTRTMARLLAGHGYRARALAIYDHLIAQDTDDLELLAEAEALRRKK